MFHCDDVKRIASDMVDALTAQALVALDGEARGKLLHYEIDDSKLGGSPLSIQIRDLAEQVLAIAGEMDRMNELAADEFNPAKWRLGEEIAQQARNAVEGK